MSTLNVNTINETTASSGVTVDGVLVKDSTVDNAYEAEFGYIDKRKAEYPPMEDYLDGIVKGDNAQVKKYIDACSAVKKKYPK